MTAIPDPFRDPYLRRSAWAKLFALAWCAIVSAQ